MKKRFLFIVLALSLVLAIIPATIVLAQEEKPTEQQTAQLNIRSFIERALNQGIIDQDTVNRIKKAWRNTPPDERPRLYERILNMIHSQYKKQIKLKISLFSALDEAVVDGLITEDKANYIKRLWRQKPPDEHRQLYRRLMNFLNP